MSTHRKNNSLSSSPLRVWPQSLAQSSLFLAGAVVGAAFLIKSLRLQAEIQVDALASVRQQQSRLSEQVNELSRKVEQLNASIEALPTTHQPQAMPTSEAPDRPVAVASVAVARAAKDDTKRSTAKRPSAKTQPRATVAGAQPDNLQPSKKKRKTGKVESDVATQLPAPSNDGAA